MFAHSDTDIITKLILVPMFQGVHLYSIISLICCGTQTWSFWEKVKGNNLQYVCMDPTVTYVVSIMCFN